MFFKCLTKNNKEYFSDNLLPSFITEGAAPGCLKSHIMLVATHTAS